MSDINAVLEGAPVEDVVEVQEDPSTSEEVGLARRMGWRPKEEYSGPDDDFVNAHEFIERGKNWAHNLTKEIDGLKVLLRNTVADNAARRKEEVAKAESTIVGLKTQIADLQKLRAEAITNHDGENVVRIEQQIEDSKAAVSAATDKVNAEKQQSQIPPIAQGMAPEDVRTVIEGWKGQNSWYTTDRSATRYANMAGDEYIADHPGATLKDVLAHVEKEVKRVFPQYGTRVPAGPDASGNDRSGVRGNAGVNGGTKKGGTKWETLDEAAQRLGEEYIERGVFKNREEFVDFYTDGDSNVPRVLAKYKKARAGGK